MRVLITGVTGYLGRRLCRELSESWHQVTGTSRMPERADVPGLLKAHAWDPNSEPLPAEALDGVDAVVNLVGESVTGRWTAEKKQRMYHSRVEGTRNVVRGLEAVKARPKVLISASAVGYYGDRGEVEVTEADGHGHDFLANLTSDWEAAADPVVQLGMRLIKLRTGLVVGQGSALMKPMVRQTWFFVGGPLGSGRQWWPWVHVDDYCGAVRFALDNKVIEGPVNVTAPNPARQRDFAKELARVMHRPSFMPAPAFLLRALLGEAFVEVLLGKKVLPKALTDAGYQFRYPDLESAFRQVLGK